MGQEGPSARGWGRWPRVTEGDKEQMSVGARLQRHPGLQGSGTFHQRVGFTQPPQASHADLCPSFTAQRLKWVSLAPRPVLSSMFLPRPPSRVVLLLSQALPQTAPFKLCCTSHQIHRLPGWLPSALAWSRAPLCQVVPVDRSF